MAKEEEKIVSIKFKVKRIEQIRLPPDKSGGKDVTTEEFDEEALEERMMPQQADFNQQNNAQG
jgi:hypothetical protein